MRRLQPSIVGLAFGFVLETSCVLEGKEIASQASDDATSTETTMTGTGDGDSSGDGDGDPSGDGDGDPSGDGDGDPSGDGDGDPGPVCGDGQLDPGEACDDGNADEEDGCSSTCEISCLLLFCDATPETCPLAAQVNADVQGMTPLGAFSGTFAAFRGAIVLGELGAMVILPEYVEGNVCASPPRLILLLGEVQQVPVYMIDAPVRYYDDQGAFVDAVATVTVHECCNPLNFCFCENPDPYWIEVVVEGDGWSLSGMAAPNCCRSSSVDEAA